MVSVVERLGWRLHHPFVVGAGAVVLAICMVFLAGCGGTPAEQAQEDAAAAAGQDAAAGETTQNMNSAISFKELAVEYLGTSEDAKEGASLLRVTGEVLNEGQDILGWVTPPNITLSATYTTSDGEATTQNVTASLLELYDEEEKDNTLSFIYDALWNLQPAESRAFAATYSVVLPQGATDPVFHVSGYEKGSEQALTVAQYDAERPEQKSDVPYLLAEPAMFEGAVSDGASSDPSAPTGTFTLTNTTNGDASQVVGLYLTQLQDGNYYYSVRSFGDLAAGQTSEQVGSLPPASGGTQKTYLNAVFYTANS